MPSRASGAVVASLLAVCACHSIPRGRTAVSALEIEGNRALDDREIERKIATRASPKFLGLWRGVLFEQEVFDESQLKQDLPRVERYYRSRGFYSARVSAARVLPAGSDQVRVVLVVDEGEPVLIESVYIDGSAELPAKDRAEFGRALPRKVTAGQRFEEDEYQRGERALEHWLADRGFAWAKVQRSAFVDVSRHRARVSYRVEIGPSAVFGAVRVEGLGDLPRSRILKLIDIQSGAPFERKRLESARQALLDLGIFGSVAVEPDLGSPAPGRAVDVRVRVEPAALHHVRFGGGFQVTALESDVHLLFSWENRNFLGGLRELTLELQPGIVLYPTRVPSLEKPTHLFPEVMMRARLRQPGFLEPRTVGQFRVQASVYPVLLVPDVQPEDPVLGYAEILETLGLERTVWKVTLAPSLNLQQNEPFAYFGEIDPSLKFLKLSYAELATRLDLRDDPFVPHAGAYVDVRMQATTGQIGPSAVTGHVRDIKLQTDASGFVPVTPHTTLAIRATIGALWPENWGDTLDDPVPSNDDIQISYFRSFFSGGPNSNRGWPARSIGNQGIAPFLNPGLTEQQLATQCTNASVDDERCRTPLGGLSLWEGSLEVRQRVEKFEFVLFCDGSDVGQSKLSYDLTNPHLSCGPGIRYLTPIGPARFDIAYRIPGLNPTAEEIQAGEDGDPGEILGLPIGGVLGLGEAF